jgi:molybdopterin-guanine dinucleotide biosynthesis protein A
VSRVTDLVDALVLAGGRIDGEFAAAVGTQVKGLAPVAGEPMLTRVARALVATPQVGRVCVVGPESVRAALPEGCLWQPETDTAFDNILAGIAALEAGDDCRILVCGADVPAISPEGAADLLARAPAEADFALPVVRREMVQARFPGDSDLYVPLREGHVTGGSQYVLRAGALRRNRELLLRLFAQRKSQLAMAGTLGLPFIARLLTRRLTIAEVERRASHLTGSHCRAVPDCHAELAFDVDSLADWRFIEEWFRRGA